MSFNKVMNVLDEYKGTFSDIPKPTIERIIAYLKKKCDVISKTLDYIDASQNTIEHQSALDSMKFLAMGIMFLEEQQREGHQYLPIDYIFDLIFFAGVEFGTFDLAFSTARDFSEYDKRHMSSKTKARNVDYTYSDSLGFERLMEVKKHFSTLGQSDHFKKHDAQEKKWLKENPGETSIRDFNAKVNKRYLEIHNGKKMETYDVLAKEFNKSSRQIARIIKKETPPS